LRVSGDTEIARLLKQAVVVSGRASRHGSHRTAGRRRRRRTAPPPPRPALAALRSAEPQPAGSAQQDNPDPTVADVVGELARRTTELTARHREFARTLAQRQSLTIPAEHPDHEHLGPAFPAWASRGARAVLQPPKPQMEPSPLIIERAVDRETDWEAAD
jgi:hypothetical protein